MKNIVITLIIGVAVCLISPAFAMDGTEKESKILQHKPYKIPNYETSINCTYCDKGDLNFTTINFDILKTGGQNIGHILLQYYPKNIKIYTTSTTDVLRLRHIEIEDNDQRKGHGTRALKTLITALRRSPALPQDVEMWLEYSSFRSHLKKFYESFGFEETNESSALETKVMKLRLRQAKFPCYKKQREKQ